MVHCRKNHIELKAASSERREKEVFQENIKKIYDELGLLMRSVMDGKNDFCLLSFRQKKYRQRYPDCWSIS